jgi:SSS family solute:Na+ symporter
MVAGLNKKRKKKVKLAWSLTLFWFLVGFGPFATLGNDLFSNPNSPSLWVPFGLPSLWVWQLLFLAYGIFVMWFLAFHMGLSEPIDPEKVKSQSK